MKLQVYGAPFQGKLGISGIPSWLEKNGRSQLLGMEVNSRRMGETIEAIAAIAENSDLTLPNSLEQRVALKGRGFLVRRLAVRPQANANSPRGQISPSVSSGVPRRS
jgi:hypothetical protein